MDGLIIIPFYHNYRNLYWVFLCLVFLPQQANSRPAHSIVLSSPVDCNFGKDCFIQNYVDLDATAGVRDYTCRFKTYDGHKGTDFRLLSTAEVAKGFPVLSAAPGLVKAVRDGMLDLLFIPGNRSQLRNRECGNGVVIDHGFGWTTQYCHLKKGSVLVRKGDKVSRSQALGLIGFSGMASFAHLHFSVRLNNRVVDPFSSLEPQPVSAEPICRNLDRSSLWQNRSLGINGPPQSILLESGFSSQPMKTDDLERGLEEHRSRVNSNSPNLTIFARFMNLNTGDWIKLTLIGPANLHMVSESKPLKTSKAHYVAYVGKKLRTERWTAGTYEGLVELIRNGKTLINRSLTLTMK